MAQYLISVNKDGRCVI